MNFARLSVQNEFCSLKRAKIEYCSLKLAKIEFYSLKRAKMEFCSLKIRVAMQASKHNPILGIFQIDLVPCDILNDHIILFDPEVILARSSTFF